MLKINALQKLRELLLKIAPIEGSKFGGAEKKLYLCIVKELLQGSEMLSTQARYKARFSAILTR